MPRSFFSQAQDNDLVQTAERIRDAANTEITGLAPYGITAADVTALTQAIDAFTAMKTAPRKAAAGRKGLTQTMPERIRNTRDIFRNQIDKMMTAFKKPNPESADISPPE
ncbi:MAG: hypothetical protein QOF24_1378 [Verrucomicrobiota bacterium]|jgi:hypothetical protein